MYTPKFDYKDLSRTTDESGKRLYQTPDGRRVPSVTTILSVTQPAEKIKLTAKAEPIKSVLFLPST